MIIQAAPRDHYDWLCDRTNYVRTRDFRAIEAVDSHGRVRGMVGYDGWTLNACRVHMAAETPIVWRHLLRPAFRYPFQHVSVLLAHVPAHSIRSDKLVRKFGFWPAYRVLDGYAPGDDLQIYEMRRENCRWLKEAA